MKWTQEQGGWVRRLAKLRKKGWKELTLSDLILWDVRGLFPNKDQGAARQGRTRKSESELASRYRAKQRSWCSGIMQDSQDTVLWLPMSTQELTQNTPWAWHISKGWAQGLPRGVPSPILGATRTLRTRSPNIGGSPWVLMGVAPPQTRTEQKPQGPTRYYFLIFK